jgi:hypothetical protein
VNEEDAEWFELPTRWRQRMDDTRNPLYAWAALPYYLKRNQPLPSWLKKYFLEAAGNINALAVGRDFRKPGEPITAKQVLGAVPEALALSRGRTKNAFARLAVDQIDELAALRSERGFEPAQALAGAVPGKKTLKRGERQTSRRLARGRALNRLKPEN